MSNVNLFNRFQERSSLFFKEGYRVALTAAILAIGLGRQIFPSLKNKEGEKSSDATFICPVCGAELEEIGWWCPCFEDRPDDYPRDISDIT